MTQQQLIELIEELFGGWEMNNLERAGPDDQPEIDRITTEVEVLIAALKDGSIIVTELKAAT